jgi:hypothetical protein
VAERGGYVAPYWTGVVWDNGTVVWRCDHNHRHTYEATACGKAEAKRRSQERVAAMSKKVIGGV